MQMTAWLFMGLVQAQGARFNAFSWSGLGVDFRGGLAVFKYVPDMPAKKAYFPSCLSPSCRYTQKAHSRTLSG